MRNLLRCRRGSIAFATVIALVPLIGVVALGAEAGSWYVTKQHAQNAADAAAYSAGLRMECDIAALTGIPCTDTQSVDYRGKQFAAQNAFCDGGDPTPYPGCPASLPSRTSRTVTITPLTSWNGVSGNFVQATVSQQQPAYLAAVLGLSTVNIPATAVAQVNQLAKPPCVLALKDPITFQGSPTLSSSTCGVASDSSATNAIGFKGNGGLNISAPSYTVGGCSQTGGSQCTNVTTYAASVPDPLSGLNSAMASLSTASFSGPCPSPPQAYNTGSTCYNLVGNGHGAFSFGNQTYPLNGVYFFSGNLVINGNTSLTTPSPSTATLILLPGSTLTISGGPLIQITAPASVSANQVPAALQSATVLALMKDLLIYDAEPYNKNGVNVTGSSNSYFDGTVYVPNTPVTYSGNSSASAPASGCYQVIAYAVTFSGNTTLDNSGCVSGTPQPQVRYVSLVH